MIGLPPLPRTVFVEGGEAGILGLGSFTIHITLCMRSISHLVRAPLPSVSYSSPSTILDLSFLEFAHKAKDYKRITNQVLQLSSLENALQHVVKRNVVSHRLRTLQVGARASKPSQNSYRRDRLTIRSQVQDTDLQT